MPSRVADLYRDLANVAGRAAEGKRALWGQTIGNLAQIPQQIQKERREEQRLNAITALEQAREARARGEEERAVRLEALAQKDLRDKGDIFKAGIQPDGSFDVAKATAKATELGQAHLVPFIHEQAQKFKPKLERIETTEPSGATTTTFAEPTPGQTFKSEPKLTLGKPEPYMVGGKRTMLQAGSDGKLYTMQRQPVDVASIDIQPDVAPLTPFQQKSLDIQERGLAQGGTLVQVMGAGGVPIWVRKETAVGQPAAQAPRAVTGAERQSLAFYNRAQDAVTTLTTAPDKGGDSLEQRMAKQSYAGQARLAQPFNILQSGEQQQYRQAQRAFTEARLRKESGAAIPTAEYENDAKTYFVQPGDDPATIAQKQKARQVVLDGLKFAAGKAYDEYYGEPNVSPARQPKADPLGLFGPKK